MKIKFIKDEDFVNYKKPAMFIGACMCDFKCCTENNLPISTCQNAEWGQCPIKSIPTDDIILRFLSNPFTDAVVFGGLEPFLQITEVIEFIDLLRNAYNSNADVVIYTGYTEEEVCSTRFSHEYHQLQQYQNVVIKFGRYVPNRPSRYDDVLGVTLASDNQYAKLL